MSLSKHAGNRTKPRVTGPEAMIETIMELGIVPFFENRIPGYSIEEMTPAGNWFDGDADIAATPWDWKIACVQTGEIAYGKFLCGGKAAFATLEWYRELRNWRQAQERYRPDAAQQQVLSAMAAQGGSIGIRDIRELLGIKKGQADALMTRLMMQCRAVTGDIVRVYRGADLHYKGWQQSSFCTPESLFDTLPFAGFPGFPFDRGAGLETTHSPEESYALLSEKIRSIVPDAADGEIARLLA